MRQRLRFGSLLAAVVGAYRPKDLNGSWVRRDFPVDPVTSLVPANAGTQRRQTPQSYWIPAFAGMRGNRLSVNESAPFIDKCPQS
jgi:hypothetical protein